jgi:anti-anti-sigma factor
VAAAPQVLTLDLREVSYLASAGLGLLLEVVQRAADAGGRVRLLVAADSAPARVLALTGLETLADQT